MISFRLLGVLLLAIFALLACGDNDEPQFDSDYGIFRIIDDSTIEMNGDINSSTLNDFNNLLAAHPDVDRINIKEVPGSADDEVNLQVSKKVHEQGISTHLMDEGLIASGGVDFFLAGTSRSKGANTMIGVHSWSDGTNEASDFPEGDANHQPYIDYYKSVGFTQSEAEAFYFFTINAASAASIHYMTEDEVEQYKVLKP